MRDLKKRFSIVDYIIFVAMLMVSILTGVYFAIKGKIFKKGSDQNLKEYLTANKNLSPIPVSMSLIASYISGITMVGTPSEIYRYGGTYWLVVVSMILSGIAVSFVFLPVFTKLRVSSSYEYLEIRFNKTLRIVASFFFLFDEVIFLPNLVYVPCLAFEQVSGVNLHIWSITTIIICAFYTIIGGIRAVVYTDTWQTIAMFVGDVVVIIAGIVEAGGFKKIFDDNIGGKRVDIPNFSPNMYERFTVFSVVVGGFFYWTSFNAVNQTMVQRYMSLPNDRSAQFTVGLFTIGAVFFISMCCFAGLLMYSQYRHCDPVSLGIVNNNDQLLPLYVLEVAGYMQGIPGLFIAGVFGAAMSSLSVIFNSVGVVFLEDFLRGVWRVNISERGGKIISIVIVVILSVVTCGLIFVVERLKGVFSVAYSLSSITTGTMFGVFALGILTPWCNTIGAMAGAIGGFLVSSIVAFGHLYAENAKLITDIPLPLSVEGCNATYGKPANVTQEPYPDPSNVFPLFRMSYLWTTLVGVFTVIIIGLITSFATGKTDLKTLDPDLISPAFKWILPEEAKNYEGTSVKKVEHLRLLDKTVEEANPSTST